MNNKAMLDSLKELGEINLKVCSQLAERQQALLTDFVEMGNAMMTRTTETKTVEDAIKNGFEFAATCNAKLMAAGNDTNEMLAANRDELQAWLQNNVKSANLDFNAAKAKSAPIKQAA